MSISSNWLFIGFWRRRSLLIYGLFISGLLCADIEIIALEPWQEVQRIAQGFIFPSLNRAEYLFEAIWLTISFALLGVLAGLIIGFPLALIYQNPLIAALCAFIRAIHELFWALVFLQIFGLSPITGILAIALPYGTTFARVFFDILSQSPKSIIQTFPAESDFLSRYFYGKIAPALSSMVSYCRYRFECALRSSAVLGFVGMPTLGFYLESAFRQGDYSFGAALLWVFIGLIGLIKFWCHRYLLPLYFIASLMFLPNIPAVDSRLVWQFLSVDIWPRAIINLDPSSSLLTGSTYFLQDIKNWFLPLWQNQILSGILATLWLSFAALGFTHLLTLLFLPLGIKSITGWFSYFANFVCLCLRSTPEYLLAFIFVLLLGPSMLPAIIALALHNSALLAFLCVKQSAALKSNKVRINNGINDYSFRVLPQIYPHFMGLLMYRFEVILRETAILGMLGVATLGFYVDSSFAEIRYANALVILFFTALLNIVVDFTSRKLIGTNIDSHKSNYCKND